MISEDCNINSDGYKKFETKDTHQPPTEMVSGPQADDVGQTKGPVGIMGSLGFGC